MTEVGCAIGRDQRRSAAARAAVANGDDPTFRLVPIGRALAERAAELGISAQLRGADALYVAVAQRLHVPIVTWDNEILKRSSDVGVIAQVPAL